MNEQQKRKNQKKHRDNIYKAFMEGVQYMTPKTLFKDKQPPRYDMKTGKQK